MYKTYIQDEILPEINCLVKKYKVWYTFKSNSTLQEYFEDNQIYLNKFFCLEELYNSFLELVEKNYMLVDGNDNIVIPNKKLQECLQTWFIYMPDLLVYCENQINILPPESILCLKLQTDSILSDICFKAPKNIIYNDPSSLFWLHPDINTLINNNKKIVYSWKELQDIFLNFCLSSFDYVSGVSGKNIFFFKSSSILTNIFKFKFFHQNQIEDILKSVTKFLGQTKTLEQCCLGSEKIIVKKSPMTLINVAINNCNKYLPPFYSSISI